MDNVHPHMDELGKYNKLRHNATQYSEAQNKKAEVYKAQTDPFSFNRAKTFKDVHNC